MEDNVLYIFEKRLQRLEQAERERDALRDELTTLTSQNDRYRKRLEQIAHRPDSEMKMALTLHYDMRMWAAKALAEED